VAIAAKLDAGHFLCDSDSIEDQMRANFRSFQLLAVALSLVSLFGCQSRTPISGSAQVGSHEVKFDLDGPGSIFMSADRPAATITFAGGTVVVESEQVLLNDSEIAKLPEDAKIVMVEHKAGKLTNTADGANIYSSAK
jgi:hypothetical protein